MGRLQIAAVLEGLSTKLRHNFGGDIERVLIEMIHQSLQSNYQFKFDASYHYSHPDSWAGRSGKGPVNPHLRLFEMYSKLNAGGRGKLRPQIKGSAIDNHLWFTILANNTDDLDVMYQLMSDFPEPVVATM